MNDFDKYYEAEEPGRRERAYGWATAIGLQDVDGLKPSHYLIETAKRNIEGEISADEARRLVDEYYEVRGEHDIPEDTVEADKVSARINQLIHSPSFRLVPEFYIALHGQIFEGVFPHAGSIRTVNISKREWVLNGDTVDYEIESEIEKTLAYDFAQNDVINGVINKPDVGINVGIKHVDDVINRQDDVINGVIKFTEKEELAVKAFIRDPKLSAMKLADLIGVKHRQAQRIIASLKEKAGLRREGARKNGRWVFGG